MESKEELMSNELMEINNIIALAKADNDVKKILLSEIAREFHMFYEDSIYEILEIAKHDVAKLQIFVSAILKDELLGSELELFFRERAL